MDIIKIVFVDERLVRLVDHRAYSHGDRSGLSAQSRGYVEIATDAHRQAFAKTEPALARHARPLALRAERFNMASTPPLPSQSMSCGHLK
jgi:hypothetical protein